MRKFIERALEKLPKLDREQISNLINMLAREAELQSVVLDSMSTAYALDREHKVILYNKSAERLSPCRSDIYDRPVWVAISDEEIGTCLRTHWRTRRGFRKRASPG
jgi:hypothetical protein